MLASLWLPIVLTGVALFFASFLSWMVLQLHKDDWKKFPKEDAVMEAVGKDAAVGSYMVPGCETSKERMSKEFVAKFEAGPRLVMTVMPNVNMGVNLGLTFVYFLVCSFLIGYLASMGFKSGTDFLTIFRFVFTAGLLTFLASMVGHSIWFRSRIVGHVIESAAYGAIAGAIFAGMWPK